MTRDPDVNIASLVKLISQDAALTGRIMKAVNSAFYALPDKMVRLDRAVAYMGLKTVKEVAISSTLSGLCKQISFGKYEDRDLWDHSVGVAIMARELARHAKTMDPEEAFLAGMLHDIGLLLEAQSEPLKGELVLTTADNGSAFMPIEKKIYGFDHTELGARLAAGWRFPEGILAGIRWHHQPEQAPPEHQALCKHLYIADMLCSAAKVGCPLTCNQQKLTDAQMAESKITQELADTVAGKLPILLRLFMS